MKRDDPDSTTADKALPPEQRNRRSQQRVDDKQRSGRGAASALSRLKMLERRYQLPLEAEAEADAKEKP